MYYYGHWTVIAKILLLDLDSSIVQLIPKYLSSSIPPGFNIINYTKLINEVINKICMNNIITQSVSKFVSSIPMMGPIIFLFLRCVYTF